MNQISLFENGQKPLKINKPVRLIELFAGIGAQAKALERLGVDFEHYRVCEFDKHAIKSYNAIHGTDFSSSDIRDWTGADLGVVDVDEYLYILTYSFPCQDLSAAGKRLGMSKGTGTRSGLLWEVERLLNECDIKPQILLMENVPQVVGSANIADFAQWLEALEGMGYTSKYRILNAKNFNVPQNRNRCFMVSWQGEGSYFFPVGKPTEKRLKNVVEAEVPERYYLSQKTVKRLIEYNSRGTFKFLPRKESEICGSLSTRSDRRDSPYLIYPHIAAMRGRDAGEGTKQTLEFGGETSNALTNVAKDNLVIEPHCRIRKLTPREYWRLMDFDDEDFEKAEKVSSNPQLYKQAGNSIVVSVLEAIFREMI